MHLGCLKMFNFRLRLMQVQPVLAGLWTDMYDVWINDIANKLIILFYMWAFTDFEKKGKKETCPVLEQFLCHVAKTGQPM